MSQIHWDGSFGSCDYYMRVQVKNPSNSKYYSWWISNGGSMQQHFMTQNFVKNLSYFTSEGEELSDEDVVKMSNTVYTGSNYDIAQLFLEMDEHDAVNYYAKVNELRATAGLPLVTPSYDYMRKIELDSIQKQSREFRPAFKELLNLNISVDDLRYSKDVDDIVRIYSLRNKGNPLPFSEDEFSQLYFKALDYIDRRDRVALINIETTSDDKLIQMGKKRALDYSILKDCGFTDTEIISHKSLMNKLQDNPATIKKAYKLLEKQGVVPAGLADLKKESDYEKIAREVKVNAVRIKSVAKAGFWCLCVAGELIHRTSHMLVGKTKRPKKSIFIRTVRKHPVKLWKQHKRDIKKAQKKKAKTEEKRRINEFMRMRVASDYAKVSVKDVFRKDEKR